MKTAGLALVLLCAGCSIHRQSRLPSLEPAPPLDVGCVAELAKEVTWLENHSNLLGRSTMSDYENGPIESGGGACGHHLRRGIRAFQATIGSAMVGHTHNLDISRRSGIRELYAAFQYCTEPEVNDHLRIALTLMLSANGAVPEELRTVPPHTCARGQSPRLDASLTTLLEYDRLLHPDD